MMKNKLQTIFVVGMLSVSSLAFAATEYPPYTNQGFYSTEKIQKPIHFVSVEGIKESLKNKAPMTVSFDIDDTLLFSSSYFQYGANHPEKFGKRYTKNQDFWDYVYEQGDESSIPKQATKDIIKMHLERGDKIIFITGRTPHRNHIDGSMDKTAQTLKKYFELPYDVPINYARSTPKDGYKWDKTYYIVKNNVSLHYGDDDKDILAAKEAGIRGIRIQRAYNSTYKQKMNGGYGEEVLINSAW